MGRSFPEVFQHFTAESMKVEPILRSAQVLMKEAEEETGLQAKDIADYVRQEQALDREERAAWRDAQKVQADSRMSEIQAEADAQRIQAEEKNRTVEIQIQMAKIETDKELALKEIFESPNSKKIPILRLIHLLVIEMLN